MPGVSVDSQGLSRTLIGAHVGQRGEPADAGFTFALPATERLKRLWYLYKLSLHLNVSLPCVPNSMV
jgi:hypothetical protein